MILFLKKLFWFPFSSKNEIEKYQSVIRDLEWDDFKLYVKRDKKFLDLGCGAGYFLEKASDELNCEVYGIDPNPGAHGVGRFSNLSNDKIKQGFAEDIHFEDEYFDTILCSHVLEHVNNEQQSLREIKRVLKNDGVLIIGMPTATMSLIALLSHYFLTSHVNILHFIQNFFTNSSLKRFIHILIPTSHSSPNHRYITYDLYKYRISNWRKIVNQEFEIIQEVKPYLYPYPDYIQFFKPTKSKHFSSSVFFVCKKYTDK